MAVQAICRRNRPGASADDLITPRHFPVAMSYLTADGKALAKILAELPGEGPGASWQTSALLLPVCAFIAIPAARFRRNSAINLAMVISGDKINGWSKDDLMRLQSLSNLICRLQPRSSERLQRHLLALELLAFSVCHEATIEAAFERMDIPWQERQLLADCVAIWTLSLADV